MVYAVYLVSALQGSSHLFFSHTECENIMVLVMALHKAWSAQRCHVIGTKVLEGKLVDGTAPRPQLDLGIHQRVAPEGLLLVVPLKMPGAQRDFTLHAGLHCTQWVVYAVVAENRGFLRIRFRLNHNLFIYRYLWCSGKVSINNVRKFEVFLQIIHTLILFATLWASRKLFFANVFSSLGDTSLAVVVPTRENHRITIELKADGTA